MEDKNVDKVKRKPLLLKDVVMKCRVVGRSVKIKMSPQILLWEGEILNQKVNFKKVSIQLSVIQDKPRIQMDESLMKN